jgi:hypothetical protein
MYRLSWFWKTRWSIALRHDRDEIPSYLPFPYAAWSPLEGRQEC